MSALHLSEIFPLTYSQLNLACFRLSPEIDRKIGNSFAWHFSKHFPNIIVIWEGGYFWVIAKPKIKITEENDWQITLETIQEKLADRVGDRAYFIQWVNAPQATPAIIAQLAVRILKIHCRFISPIVFNQNKVQIKRECNFWAETFTHKQQIQAAIALTIKSIVIYQETLEYFLNNHPYRNDPEQLLIDLLVRDIDSNSTATIVSINGTIGEHKERLLKQATGSTSKEQLQIAPNNQPVVSVKFGSNSHVYDYPIAALCPRVTSQTAAKFDIEYGELLKQTKLTYKERQKLLSRYKQEANKTLIDYGINFKQRCLHSGEYSDLFWQPATKLEDTLLLFGRGVTKPKKQTLRGLSEGGVYYRHREFQDFKRPIRLAILNFTSLPDKPFYDGLESFLRRYKFPLVLTRENIRKASLEELSLTEAKVKVETLVDEVIQVPIDLVLVFLPESDRARDDRNGDSIYAWVFQRLLRRKLASQIIYEKTLRELSKYVFDQVVPGILAKLGNLPFILAEPLTIADYFIGLDISRRTKKNGNGSINACASVRLYGKQGQFIRYQLADDSATEGEEIPARILHDFLPLKELRNKKVLIYRDGIFRGAEVECLIEWSQAINAEFILVECVKSQIPRLYNFADQNLIEPTRGLALELSSREVILVTTQVAKSVGLSRPLRLKIREEGASVNLKALVDTTLKLTLLHHGSLKDPRLPIPLFGADRIAYRRLQGIYPGELEGDKQYWL